jgi:hypothetical protein
VNGSSEYGNHNFGSISNADNNTKWMSKGMEEYVNVELANYSNVKRVDVYWDRDLARTGRFKVSLSPYNKYFADMFEPGHGAQSGGNMDGGLISVVDFGEGHDAKWIRITCYGQHNSDLNGIVKVNVWGTDATGQQPKDPEPKEPAKLEGSQSTVEITTTAANPLTNTASGALVGSGSSETKANP